jgi:hypothetical protein
MMAALFPWLIFSAVIGAGLNAGLFFIFSVCIMGALARLPAEQGIAAMQAINVVILNPLFLLVFMGTAVLSLVRKNGKTQLAAALALAHLCGPELDDGQGRRHKVLFLGLEGLGAQLHVHADGAADAHGSA